MIVMNVYSTEAEFLSLWQCCLLIKEEMRSLYWT